MGVLKETPYVVIPGEIVLLRVKDTGVYVYIRDVVRDETTKNRAGWIVTLSILVYGLPEQTIRVNDEHIRGEEFTMGGEFRQFCPVDFTGNSKKETRPTLRLIRGGNQ